MKDSICLRCKHKSYCYTGVTQPSEHSSVTGCSRFKQISPMTNADKIRAMTDKEMADTIYACPPDYAKLSEDEICIKFNDECKACWLDWLQKEADE